MIEGPPADSTASAAAAAAAAASEVPSLSAPGAAEAGATKEWKTWSMSESSTPLLGKSAKGFGTSSVSWKCGQGRAAVAAGGEEQGVKKRSCCT
jgi:hypothetical protein